MHKLPIARNTNIVEQESGKEVLIYDLKSHRFFTLNETSAIIYKACNGVTSFADLKSKYKFTDDLIYFTLDELKRHDLLDDYQSGHFGNLSRRAVIKRVGLASLIALPVISSLVAPLPVSAASAGCTSNADCFANPATPYCSTATNTCVQCRANADCPANTVCNTGTNTCVQCISNIDCFANPATPYCNALTNTCVECFTNFDCFSPTTPVCVNNTCVPV